MISREDVAYMKMPRVRKLNVHSNLKVNLNNSLQNDSFLKKANKIVDMTENDLREFSKFGDDFS